MGVLVGALKGCAVDNGQVHATGLLAASSLRDAQPAGTGTADER
jgi:hypothetical protein